MKEKIQNLIIVPINLMIISAIGCQKKEENIDPTVTFLQPDENLIIKPDTVLRCMVDAINKHLNNQKDNTEYHGELE